MANRSDKDQINFPSDNAGSSLALQGFKAVHRSLFVEKEFIAHFLLLTEWKNKRGMIEHLLYSHSRLLGGKLELAGDGTHCEV